MTQARCAPKKEQVTTSSSAPFHHQSANAEFASPRRSISATEGPSSESSAATRSCLHPRGRRHPRHSSPPRAACRQHGRLARQDRGGDGADSGPPRRRLQVVEEEVSQDAHPIRPQDARRRGAAQARGQGVGHGEAVGCRERVRLHLTCRHSCC